MWQRVRFFLDVPSEVVLFSKRFNPQTCTPEFLMAITPKPRTMVLNQQHFAEHNLRKRAACRARSLTRMCSAAVSESGPSVVRITSSPRTYGDSENSTCVKDHRLCLLPDGVNRGSNLFELLASGFCAPLNVCGVGCAGSHHLVKVSTFWHRSQQGRKQLHVVHAQKSNPNRGCGIAHLSRERGPEKTPGHSDESRMPNSLKFQRQDTTVPERA